MELEGRARHKHYIGLGHTRWATHGDKTDLNAHPHYDHRERLALIHNGLIENYHALKESLATDFNLIPLSQTDTEIVALWIGVYLDQGHTLSQSIQRCVERLEGAYSFVLISVLEPDSMYIVKNTGTMVIGVAPELAKGGEVQKVEGDIEGNTSTSSSDNEQHLFQIVASDTTVFQDHTRQYYNIEDKQILKLTLTDRVEPTLLQTAKEERVQVRLPPGIDHYYVMEMLDQPNAVCKALNYGARLGNGVKLGGLE